MAELDQIKKESGGEAQEAQLPLYRESPCAIRFIDQTVFVELVELLAETFEPIPSESFSHSDVCLSVFADLARLLDANLLRSCDEPKVVVATNINPKAVIPDAISDTNFYFGMSMMLRKVFLSEKFS
ncbi:unnamed protein product [Brassica oleracea var. botrytis]|uniref:Uncharacterized protein n=2 Tax=Brassica oleracea TaxID=3712 RepID=A0A0D3DRK9_BRAOL|nr:unnamed protein product [Brassica oleracea]